MSKLAMHVEHYKSGAVGAIDRHNKRLGENHTNERIVPERKSWNITILDPGKDLLDVAKEAATASSGRVTKNSVFISEWVIYPPEELQDPESADKEKLTQWANDTVQWLREKGLHPESAIIHRDETTNHLHVDTIPLTADNRLSRKELYTRENLFNYHTELSKYLQEKGWDVQRGDVRQPGQKGKSKTVREYKVWAEQEKKAMQAELDSLRSENEKLKEDNEKKGQELQAKERELEQRQQHLEAIKSNYNSVKELVQEKQQGYSDLIHEYSKQQRLLFDKNKEIEAAQEKIDELQEVLSEKEGLLRSRDLEIREQYNLLVEVNQEVADMVEYQERANGCWRHLEALRELLLNQYGSKWPFRSKKAERAILDAVEVAKNYITAAVVAMAAFEVRSRMPEERRMSPEIERGLKKSLELIVTDADERSKGSEKPNFEHSREKKRTEIER